MSRAIDVVFALVLLGVLSPLLALIAIANKVFTGAVLFRQIRVGKAMRPFTILKFQTMVTGSSGTTITVSNDQRVTRFGRLLRMFKLDEFPQLVNVLRGEMSLVGPRALPPNEVDRIPGEVASLVYSVRPGMTGLAALLFVNEERLLSAAEKPDDFYFDSILPRKMALDSQYVRRKSPWIDLLILACTPVAVLAPSLSRKLLVTLGRFETRPEASPACPPGLGSA